MPGVAIVGEAGMGRIKQPARLVLVLAVVAVGMVWAARKSWEVTRYHRAIKEIERNLEAGRYAVAARSLEAMLYWNPGSDEVAYLLGVCQKARGRNDAAVEAWAQVPPGSSFAPQAINGRIELEIDRGRLAAAEQLIDDSIRDPAADESGLRLLLGPAYCNQGRVEEASRFIEARWNHLARMGQGASEAAINLVRLHIEQQHTNIPVEHVRSFLDRAARLAPEDDRVRLGQANLAIRTGSYDEAARLLDGCLRRRPLDAPVWRARLNWAMATGRVRDARVATEQLPAPELTPALVQKLVAWFAAQREDTKSERAALTRLIAADPADFTALDRLVELEVKEGQPDSARELRRKKIEIDRLRVRYQELFHRHQPLRDAAEMARIAEQLGRRFEARAFLTLAVAVDPDRDKLQSALILLNKQTEITNEPGGTLADLLGSDPNAQVGVSISTATPSAARGARNARLARP
jgi:thioredoxin-like negative regulator of GroEL